MKVKTRVYPLKRGLNPGLLLALLALLLGNPVLASAPPAVQAVEAVQMASESTAEAAPADLPTGASTDWWASVQENIRQSEYHVTWQEQTYLPDVPAAYHAPNRAHDLRTYFTPAGPVIIPRSGVTGRAPLPWRWGLRLVAWGLTGALQPAGPAALQADANRIEYRRGTLTEWYVNDERGLEQGFQIAAPPAQDAHSRATLIIELALDTDLASRMDESSTAVEFVSAGGVVVLRYSDLYASDAAGRALPASLSLSPTSITISVDSSNAVYPITIDPLATTPDWTVEGDQFNGHLGWSVGAAGDVNGDGYADIIVGAPGYMGTGSVFVFHGSPCGPGSSADWRADAPPTIAHDFGRAVATAGDVNGDGYDDIIIGSGYSNGQTHEGAVFVYHGSASGLGTTPNWSVEGNHESGQLGWSVGTAGDVNGDGWDDVIAGAPASSYGQTYEGVAYVWYGSSTGLGSLGDWAAEGNLDNAWFGFAVGTAGDVNGDAYDDIIIGAPDYGIANRGAAFVYYGSGTGLGGSAGWTHLGEVYHGRMGAAVGAAGDVNGDGWDDVIVGAPGEDILADPDVAGQVFVFHGSESGLSANDDWNKRSDLVGFGASVGTAGDVSGDGYADVVVGAHGRNAPAGLGVWIYRGSAGGMGFLSIWNAEGGHSGGTAGDVNGDGYADVIVGQPGYDGSASQAGRALLYYGGAPPGPAPDWTKESGQADAGFGAAVATAGDVNGDGYDEIIVGSPGYDHGQSNEGLAFVYAGTATGPNPVPYWFAESDQVDAGLGGSVGTAGDVNGDGYADVVVAATGYDSASYTNNGAVFGWYGSPAGLGPNGIPANADWSGAGTRNGTGFGWQVGAAGDVNGDGYADVIVGEPGLRAPTPPNTAKGRAYLFHGSGTGLSATADWTVECAQDYALFGQAVGTAGDVNGDGYADVIVGAPEYDNNPDDQIDAGRAFVYHGSRSGLRASAAWIAEGDRNLANLGFSVGTAGDVNGDGYADVIVGAPFAYYGTYVFTGMALVWHGSATGLGATGTMANADWATGCNQHDAFLGGSVGTAGDVNGDGYADVIVGAQDYDAGLTDVGGAFIYHGSTAGLGAEAAWLVVDDQQETRFGSSVSTAGDVNGDGYSDIIVGASRYDNGQTNEGRAYVWYGSAGSLSAAPDWLRDGTQGEASFGSAVGTAGDVNGDGYADLIVGAYRYDNGQTDEGAAFVCLGSASGLSPGYHWIAEGNQAGAYFGRAVGTAGDVNGDGYDDVIVGADNYDNGETDEGAVYVWHGSATGLGIPGQPSNADWSAESNQVGAYLGRAVGTAGDVNGDGYADVIVGAWKYDHSPDDEGAAYVWHGSAAGLGAGGTPANASWSAESNQADSRFGWSVASAGDVNRDGYSDVIVGAYQYDNGQTDEGRAMVWLGSGAGLGNPGTPANADWVKESDKAYAYFGISVGTAGDVNGDGRSDVVVGAPNYEHGQDGEGMAFVYAGTASGLNAPPLWSAESDLPYTYFGGSVGTAGDVNGDGYADVVVGARSYACGYPGEGAAFVYHGSSLGPSAVADWAVLGGQEDAYLGDSVSTAGDVNGDGYADVAVGAYRYDGGGTDTGRVLVYYGNGGTGRSLHPRQQRSDGSTPIAHLGQSSVTAFRLALLGRTFFGRGKVRLEWEVKPLGTPFDGSGTQQSTTWLDSGTAGVEIGQLVSGLSANTAYHWRVRLRYNPGVTPFQQHGRWLTVPWNGWQEQDLRTGSLPAATTVVGFSSLAYAVGESTVPFTAALQHATVAGGAISITVQLDATSSNTVTVDYATLDGTASAGKGGDYTATNGTLTFAPGVTKRTFAVYVLDDTEYDPDETIILALSNATNALIGASPATLTIVDDEVFQHTVFLPFVLRNG